MGKPTVTEESVSATRATRVLIAENDEAMRAFLISSLQRLGYDVSAMASYDEVRQYLEVAFGLDEERALPDLIISGICTPGQTVIDTLVKFKQTAHDIPVVLITALEDPAIHERALGLGAAAVFDKPFNIEILKDFLLERVPPSTGRRKPQAIPEREHCIESDGPSGPNIA